MSVVAVCDSDQQGVVTVCKALGRYGRLRGTTVQTRSFGTGDELLSAVLAGDAFDLLIMETVLSGVDGVTAAGRLREAGVETPIFYVSSTGEYALDAFRVHASQYFIKPVDDGIFFMALDKVFSATSGDDDRLLQVLFDNSAVMIPFSSIVCVKTKNNPIRYSLKNGEEISGVKTIPETSATASLLKDERFLRAGTYIVNLEYVEEIKRGVFIMENGEEIPVPINRYREVERIYVDFLASRGGRLLYTNKG